MKRILCLLLALIITTPVFASETVTIPFHEAVHVYYEDVLLTFDVPPVISDDRIIAPVREISEALGASVSWDDQTKTAFISTNDTAVSFTIGKKTMTVNGSESEIDVAAEIISGRTFVPLRALAEALNLKVRWRNDIRSAFLSPAKPFASDYLITPTHYVASGVTAGCVIACKAMVLSNYFNTPFAFEEILELNGGTVYTNWGPQYCMDLSWDVIFQSELALKQEKENWEASAYTPTQKLKLIASELVGSTGIIAQFNKDGSPHGIVITGFTAQGELVVCDPNTKSETPENTLIGDSCLANMYKLYSTDELLPYLISMRKLEK